MLPASARVRSRSEHRLVAARGRRARRGPLVVHLMPPPAPTTDPTPSGRLPARAGVVVGKRVGNAVTRNLVKRRLREHLRNQLPALPEGSLVVVRALPGAGVAGHPALGQALDGALRSLAGSTSAGPASDERRVDA